MKKFTKFWNKNSNNKRLVVMLVCFQVCFWVGVYGMFKG
jgi:hypothetical protein